MSESFIYTSRYGSDFQVEENTLKWPDAVVTNVIIDRSLNLITIQYEEHAAIIDIRGSDTRIKEEMNTTSCQRVSNCDDEQCAEHNPLQYIVFISEINSLIGLKIVDFIVEKQDEFSFVFDNGEKISFLIGLSTPKYNLTLGITVVN